MSYKSTNLILLIKYTFTTILGAFTTDVVSEVNDYRFNLRVRKALLE